MEYVLAMYDVRGKQDFIFRTNKLKEIAGASWMIRDCFQDYLFPAAQKISKKGIFTYKNPDGSEKSDAAFSVYSFKNRMKEGYIGEVVYDGGGNFLLLFRNEETFRKVTYQFTRDLMEEIGTLRVLGTCVPVSDFSDYRADSKALYAKHRKHEMQESMISPWSCLPIVQVDRSSSQPLLYVKDQKGLPQELRSELIGEGKGGSPQKYSKESLAKRRKFYSVMQKAKTQGQTGSAAERYFNTNEDVFDRMVLRKGEDSQLAVVYIDGNSMGAKVETCLGDSTKPDCKTTYEDCVRALRDFSKQIQKIYIEDGVAAAMEGKEKERAQRIVVYAGDEINFVLNAHDALSSAVSYLNHLPKGHSACAGIAVFHSHSPYAEAYRVAEECCESGKKKMKKFGIADACFLDFHICQGAVGISLDEIRKEETGGRSSRPWMIRVGASDADKADQFIQEGQLTDWKDVQRLTDLFRTLGRTNVKDLADRALKGSVELSMELLRIRAHLPEEKKAETKETWEWLGIESGAPITEEKRWLIYDVVLGYDLWFAKDKPAVEQDQAQRPGPEKHGEGPQEEA